MIGVFTQKYVGFELTQTQLLDISRGLSFLHSLEIVHGDLKGVCLGFFPGTPQSAALSPFPISE